MCLISFFVFIVILLVCLKVYLKLSTGICKSSRHLVGKVVIVTGANSGIGFEAAKDFADRGAKLILGCRTKSKGIAARDSIIASSGNSNVHFLQLDLASFASVRAFADEIIKTEKKLDVLVNNAGMFESENVKTEDGLLVAMQSNHFGPFLLTSLLLPLLKASAPSRILNMSSGYHRLGKIDFDNLNNEKEIGVPYNYLQVYKNSKLCNVLISAELSRRLEGTGVTSNSLHPGIVNTEAVLGWTTWYRHLLPIVSYFFKSPWEGAQTTVHLTVAPELEKVTGKYFGDCKEETPSKLGRDKNLARKLWEVTEKIVGLKE